MTEDYKAYEFEVLCGLSTDCQKTLNQWRHIYWLRIINMSITNDRVCILLARRKFS